MLHVQILVLSFGFFFILNLEILPVHAMIFRKRLLKKLIRFLHQKIKYKRLMI